MAWKPKNIDITTYPDTIPDHVSTIFGNFKRLENVLLIDQELLQKYRQHLPPLKRWYIEQTIQEMEVNQEVYRKELEKILELIPIIETIHLNLSAWQKEKRYYEL